VERPTFFLDRSRNFVERPTFFLHRWRSFVERPTFFLHRSRSFLECPTFFPLVDLINVLDNGVMSRGFWGEVRVNDEDSQGLGFILSFSGSGGDGADG